MSSFYLHQKTNYLNRFLLICGFLFFSLSFFSQTVTITSPVASATYCAGTSVTVNYTLTSNFGAANTFSTQLSDVTGSFASPVLLGTRTASTSGGSSFTIPYTTATGSAYRIRVLASSPAYTSQSNGVDLTINGLALSTPTVPNATYCQGEIFNVSYTQNCAFAAANVYSVQLSDASGSFAAPVTVGTRTSTTAAAITCTVPASPAGTGYRIRIVSSNPIITSPDNGSNITINAAAGNPTVFGSGTWNAYCFNNFNNYVINYQGYYTEDNLSFNTQTRFINTNSPSTATVGVGSTGLAYAGCPFGSGSNYSISYKRTNIPCGYYQVDIPGHDDNMFFNINGVQVFVHNGCCDAHTNIWTGIIKPSDQLEFGYTNGGGPGYLTVNFIPINPLTMSPPVTICAGTTTSLTVTNSSTLALNYSWSPAATLSPSTGSMVVATASSTTIYTVNSSDAGGTACSLFTNTVLVTTNPVPTTTISSVTSTLICSGISNSTLTASGANSYTWSPAAGLNTTTGNSVIASPTVNTTYTVSGSNNCSTVDATKTISVQTIPAAPTPTAFGNNVWNVYCYNDLTFTNYYGYYTENNLSFDSRTRWNTNNPMNANATSGLAYQGCNLVALHGTTSKRTNFTCGYYQMDIPAHDDNVTVLINGVQVFQHIGCCDVHTNVWTGFLGASTTVEIRQTNNGGGGSYIAANFSLIPYPILNPPVTICAGTSASLTASPYIVGANYVWGPAASLTVTTTGTLVPASPTVGTNYTCTVTDPVTTCSAAASVFVTVNPLPTTTVSPTSGIIRCSAQQYTLTAGGANTYSWSPSAGLSATSGYTVVANPTVTTVYTVTGNNNCSGIDAITTITVIPLPAQTTYTNNAWNVFCHNNTTLSNYYGYYKHFGTGASGYDFNTATQWVSGIAPSTATANASGTAYQGCVMSATNISLSFKRTGFTCGTYSIVCNSNDDGVTLFIDGVQLATRATSASSVALWVGTLNQNSQVEFQLVQTTGTSGLSVKFTAAATTPSLSTWIGGTSTDWFTASNWCGSGIPTATTDALIPNSKPQFMPIISGVGAACRSLTISAASASTAVTSALPSASLTLSGSNSLDVFGNWVNNGSFNGGSGTVNILGATSTSITGASSETFYNLVINKSGANTVTIPTGTLQISNAMTFVSGIVNQNSLLRFLNGSSTSGANNTSYVNGQVNKVGTQAFTFPVGVSNFYRPISITAPSVATDHFTAQYFLADPSPPYTYSSKDVTIDHIGRCEYWILNRTGGSSNVSVTLTWNSTSCGVTNLSDLIVARWDAGQVKWKDEGNGGTTGNTTTGTIISSAPVTNFSPFTLASRTSFNPLPIELIYFNCSYNENSNSLSWTTASESNNDHFDIERSLDGLNFEVIGKKKGAGNSLTKTEYSFFDQNSPKGISYYRLKQVDFDQKYTYSEVCSITNNGTEGVSFYPNPVRNDLTIDYYIDNSKPSNISVTDVLGKSIQVKTSFTDSKITIDCSDLVDGIYFVKVTVGTKEVVNKFTVQK
jgi:hypothetical protein